MRISPLGGDIRPARNRRVASPLKCLGSGFNVSLPSMSMQNERKTGFRLRRSSSIALSKQLVCVCRRPRASPRAVRSAPRHTTRPPRRPAAPPGSGGARAAVVPGGAVVAAAAAEQPWPLRSGSWPPSWDCWRRSADTCPSCDACRCRACRQTSLSSSPPSTRANCSSSCVRARPGPAARTMRPSRRSRVRGRPGRLPPSCRLMRRSGARSSRGVWSSGRTRRPCRPCGPPSVVSCRTGPLSRDRLPVLVLALRATDPVGAAGVVVAAAVAAVVARKEIRTAPWRTRTPTTGSCTTRSSSAPPCRSDQGPVVSPRSRRTAHRESPSAPSSAGGRRGASWGTRSRSRPSCSSRTCRGQPAAEVVRRAACRVARTSGPSSAASWVGGVVCTCSRGARSCGCRAVASTRR